MKNRILIGILLPVLMVGLILAGLSIFVFSRPLGRYMQKQADAELHLAALLGLETCEESFNYLLDLRLENDPGMTAAFKKESLAEIMNVRDKIFNTHLLVADGDGRIIGTTLPSAGDAIRIDDLKKTDGEVFGQRLFGQPGRMSVRYFPLWRWYIIGYASEADLTAPIGMARRIVYAGTLGVLVAVVFTLIIVFHLKVNQPLHEIIRAAAAVARGDHVRATVRRRNEIGTVAEAFNAMVESLAEDQRQIRSILQALKESEEMYRLITEHALSEIIMIQDDRIIFANRKMIEDSGYGAEEMTGMAILDLIHPEDRETFQDCLDQLNARSGRMQFEIRIATRRGDVRYMEFSAAGTMYRDRRTILCHGIDISEKKEAEAARKRLEDRLNQARKLEAVGTLAGGIAHDFNNLLMGIQGNVSLMQMRAEPGHPFEEKLKNVETAVARGSELTRQLLGFAREGKYEVKQTDINALVRDTAEMFGRTRKEIAVKTALAPDAGAVCVDPGQIEQALLNIFVNAWQAMPGGGELTIRTANAMIRERDPEGPDLAGGAYVMISATDTGEGMAPDIQKRIFDPFFTTRQRERGTGMGLASAYGIIKNHGGAIAADSRPGEGATFTIYLPVVAGTTGEEKAEDMTQTKEEWTVLLVDDEDMIIEVGEEMLTVLGCRVITARSGREAAEVLAARGDAVDLVVLDMIMPGMNGRETFEAVKQVRPDVKVLLASGYSMDGEAAEIMKQGCDGFIQKPFNLNRLSGAIRKIMNRT